MESLTFAILVSIDSSERIGATSIYGTSEIAAILKAGAEVRGYKHVTVSYVETPIRVPRNTKFEITANIE